MISYSAMGRSRKGIVRRGEPLGGEALEEGYEREERVRERKEMKLPTVDLTLDKSGSIRTTISNLPKLVSPKEILSENGISRSQWRNSNCFYQNSSMAFEIPHWNQTRLLAVSKEAFKFHIVVVDLSGKPVPNASVKVDLFERKIFTHRKRLVGGFYAYEHSNRDQKSDHTLRGENRF